MSMLRVLYIVWWEIVLIWFCMFCVMLFVVLCCFFVMVESMVRCCVVICILCV